MPLDFVWIYVSRQVGILATSERSANDNDEVRHGPARPLSKTEGAGMKLNLAPNWREALETWLRVLATPGLKLKERKEVIEELERMADAADSFNVLVDDLGEDAVIRILERSAFHSKTSRTAS
jgi:hypothetical protein